MGEQEIVDLRKAGLDVPQQQPWQIKALYHKQNINKLKGELGKTCSYLSYVSYSNGNYGVKAIINNKNITVALGGTPDDVDNESYSSLKEQLLEYVKEK